MWQILKDQTWSCTWRYAGGIIADMLQQGDYIDWYCSGIVDGSLRDVEDDAVRDRKGYVGEGIITNEVREDLARLGWLTV